MRLIVFYLLLPVHSVFACSCRPHPVAEAKQSTPVIFAGKVENVRYVDPESEWEPRIVVTFSVSRVWKGDVPKSFTMYSNRESSMCEGFFGEFLKPGKELLVYASEGKMSEWKTRARGTSKLPDDLAKLSDTDSIYSTSICTRTRPIEDAAEDLKSLGSAEKSYQ